MTANPFAALISVATEAPAAKELCVVRAHPVWTVLSVTSTHAAQKPGASLLLPEPSATLSLPESGRAAFTSTPAAGDRQLVELRWQSGSGEQVARYLAQARSIEPLYVRTLSAQTLLTSAIAAFVLSLFLGRSLRRRWLARPGFLG